MTKEEIITNQQFHQWKQNDCTKALIELITLSINRGREEIINGVENTGDINVNYLNFLKGKLHSFYELQQHMLDKDTLESVLTEVEDVQHE